MAYRHDDYYDGGSNKQQPRLSARNLGVDTNADVPFNSSSTPTPDSTRSAYLESQAGANAARIRNAGSFSLGFDAVDNRDAPPSSRFKQTGERNSSSSNRSNVPHSPQQTLDAHNDAKRTAAAVRARNAGSFSLGWAEEPRKPKAEIRPAPFATDDSYEMPKKASGQQQQQQQVSFASKQQQQQQQSIGRANDYDDYEYDNNDYYYPPSSQQQQQKGNKLLPDKVEPIADDYDDGYYEKNPQNDDRDYDQDADDEYYYQQQQLLQQKQQQQQQQQQQRYEHDNNSVGTTDDIYEEQMRAAAKSRDKSRSSDIFFTQGANPTANTSSPRSQAAYNYARDQAPRARSTREQKEDDARNQCSNDAANEMARVRAKNTRTSCPFATDDGNNNNGNASNNGSRGGSGYGNRNRQDKPNYPVNPQNLDHYELTQSQAAKTRMKSYQGSGNILSWS